MITMPTTLLITPDMLDANGAITGVDFGRSDLRHILIRVDVETLIIDHALIAPSVRLWIKGPTTLEIRGDASFDCVIDKKATDLPPGGLIVHGTLSAADSIMVHGTIHATGSICSAGSLVATQSIHCNGAITASRI